MTNPDPNPNPYPFQPSSPSPRPKPPSLLQVKSDANNHAHQATRQTHADLGRAARESSGSRRHRAGVGARQGRARATGAGASDCDGAGCYTHACRCCRGCASHVWRGRGRSGCCSARAGRSARLTRGSRARRAWGSRAGDRCSTCRGRGLGGWRRLSGNTSGARRRATLRRIGRCSTSGRRCIGRSGGGRGAGASIASRANGQSHGGWRGTALVALVNGDREAGRDRCGTRFDPRRWLARASLRDGVSTVLETAGRTWGRQHGGVGGDMVWLRGKRS